MSFWPGEKLRYAETHFKFKLPWSLLYRPWPEITFDMPFQAVPGEIPNLWIVVRDADRFPVTLESAEISVTKLDNGKGSTESRSITLDKTVKSLLEFIAIPMEGLSPGKYSIVPKITVSRQTKKSHTDARTFTRWNLPSLKPQAISLQVLANDVPKGDGFVYGEMHCHTHYSRDHVEYGATPAVLQQAAKCVGLDFVSCTDHAYDFAFTESDYTQEADSPVPRFQKLRDEIAQLPQGNGYPLMLAGEEVSAGNCKGENVHMTVLAPEGYLPGLGDCGRYWLENTPTRKIPQLLDSTKAHCFAAHPLQPMGLLEKFIFRRGYWAHEDLNLDKAHRIRGIQFWNGVRDEGFKLGREFWINELGKGNFLLPIGGNDAHGDLNDTTVVSLPLFSLCRTRDHVFGKVRTAVKIQDSKEAFSGEATTLSCETLNKAFDADNCYITDGPALWWEKAERQVTFKARNIDDFGGGFRYIRIYGRRKKLNAKQIPDEELCRESLVATRAAEDIVVNTDNFAYLRAECESADGHFAMTSAIPLE